MREDHSNISDMVKDGFRNELKPVIDEFLTGQIDAETALAKVESIVQTMSVYRSIIDQERRKYEVVAWNTGRRYSAKGQRIAAKLLPDGWVVFFDLDRHIVGVIAVRPAEIHDLQGFVMRNYDGCEYNVSAHYRHLDYTEAVKVEVELRNAALNVEPIA